MGLQKNISSRNYSINLYKRIAMIDYTVRKILVPTDFSEHANNALGLAAEIATETDAELTLLTVVNYPGGTALHTTGVGRGDPAENKYIQELTEKVQEKIKDLPDDIDLSDINLKRKVQVGNPFTHISDEITQNDTDLVIMGTKGTSGLNEVLIGSNTERVVRHAKCPVISVKEKISVSNIDNIAFAVDPKIEDELFFSKVKQLQHLFKANLHVVMINTPNHFLREIIAMKLLEDMATRNMFKDYKVYTFSDITEEEGIIYFADQINADLIAMGTQGRTGIAHLISGSIAEEVVNHAKRPVWTYRLSK